MAVDHRLDHWLQVADTLCVMENGAITETAPMDHPPASDWLEERGIIVPHRPYRAPVSHREAGDTALSLSHVTVRLGGKPVLLDCSADFAAGQVHAILGESGCGKSTLLAR